MCSRFENLYGSKEAAAAARVAKSREAIPGTSLGGWVDTSAGLRGGGTIITSAVLSVFNQIGADTGMVLLLNTLE